MDFFIVIEFGLITGRMENGYIVKYQFFVVQGLTFGFVASSYPLIITELKLEQA